MAHPEELPLAVAAYRKALADLERLRAEYHGRAPVPFDAAEALDIRIRKARLAILAHAPQDMSPLGRFAAIAHAHSEWLSRARRDPTAARGVGPEADLAWATAQVEGPHRREANTFVAAALEAHPPTTPTTPEKEITL